jgi:TatD DNase family protein
VSRTLPSIDAHAHIETTVSANDLEGLRALIFAMTRDSTEWKRALGRSDALTVWGIGVHPGVARAIDGFDRGAFREALTEATVIGEVGLDGSSKVPMDKQREVLDAILSAAQDQSRPISLHSVRAARQVLAALRERPVAAPILHWWRGSESETEQALELGCFFSLNGAEAKRPKVLGLLPRDRVLTETDYPHSRGSDRAANRPAATATIEQALEEAWDLDSAALRRRLWHTFGEIAAKAEIEERLPARVQEVLLTVGEPSAT